MALNVSPGAKRCFSSPFTATVNLYDWYAGVRGLGAPAAHVEALWPITGRGAVM
jgi:hypothetical protein